MRSRLDLNALEALAEFPTGRIPCRDLWKLANLAKPTFSEALKISAKLKTMGWIYRTSNFGAGTLERCYMKGPPPRPWIYVLRDPVTGDRIPIATPNEPRGGRRKRDSG